MQETNEQHDARVQAALAAWRETLRTATVDEEPEDTEWGAMEAALHAADELRAAR
ncbi:hypothetical protein MKK88_33590 [Methylobacterium sp. E-005]|uniref:hypothetical protein n=1 Tax=Methylobacterium sp. E-005 TaxID=2836549 RepID=UPI001FB864DE|nr:hypothetical protein [Methylobacterium sp. E-005]MCJ2090880.1 hypothetical protein [Methylobacterium sp. E-005]